MTEREKAAPQNDSFLPLSFRAPSVILSEAKNLPSRPPSFRAPSVILSEAKNPFSRPSKARQSGFALEKEESAREYGAAPWARAEWTWLLLTLSAFHRKIRSKQVKIIRCNFPTAVVK